MDQKYIYNIVKGGGVVSPLEEFDLVLNSTALVNHELDP
jgi:hypothetical protein